MAFIPANGLSFGAYPQRDLQAVTPFAVPDWRRLAGRRSGVAAIPPVLASALARYRRRCVGLSDAAIQARLGQLCAGLRQDGFAGKPAIRTLAVVADVMRRQLGFEAYETQLTAAWHMLQGGLVEMRTGEGKTLAAALTAGVAGVAGCPVFVLTANDYLVRRDHDDFAPFYQALGLSTGLVVGTDEPADRPALWRRDVVYSSARELAFDYLRDHMRLGGDRDALIGRAAAICNAAAESQAVQAPPTEPIVPGLCFGIVDEADSLLLDEATTPLILAAQGGRLDAAGLKKAYAVARGLQGARDYSQVPGQRRIRLNDVGYRRVEAALAEATGVLHPLRRAAELVETALAAMHLYRIGVDYAVVADKVVLIDELTGRIAEGRHWQGALQQMVEIKEGLELTPPAQVSAQITYQRLFPRFLHLCGMSGTLADARSEFARTYGLRVLRVALARPDQRIDYGELVFPDAASKWQAVLASIREHQEQGRPVLVGNDSVTDSAHLSTLLSREGIEHQVLNATQCSQEAASLKRAGRAGVVTVTTNMAGRGTDIRLTGAARRNGGLHVIATMRNRSRRIDRQLAGRAARHGDPGSHQVMLSLEDRLISRVWPIGLLRMVKSTHSLVGYCPQVLYRAMFRGAQYIEERKDLSIRRALRDNDRLRHTQLGFAGRTE